MVQPVTVYDSHHVQKGECLWIISEYERIYADPFKWPLIYKANRSQINDPDLIFPGQDLAIPRNSNPSEIEDAINTARKRGPWSLFDGK
jgi:nucleoid-associated protein YgaU